MNLKVLFGLLIYYTLLSLFFVAGSSFTQDFNSTISLNETDMGTEELQEDAGLFSTGVSFSRFVMFIGFGIGLPDDTPSILNLMFISWQTLLTIFVIGFVISSIWNG